MILLHNKFDCHLGRSNVGKSSLLNALTRQWGVVRTSDKPGLTQVGAFIKSNSVIIEILDFADIIANGL